MSGSTTVVKAADMPDEMKETAQSACEEAVKCADKAKEALSMLGGTRGDYFKLRNTFMLDGDTGGIAGIVKKKLDEKYGMTWHCVVGTNFGSFITHEQNRFIYLYVEKFAILLFKSA